MVACTQPRRAAEEMGGSQNIFVVAIAISISISFVVVIVIVIATATTITTIIIINEGTRLVYVADGTLIYSSLAVRT
ncbi:hypothetical protein F4818DRAFT_442636 [Hypoxylon cercidicola]|nr:hypothetical protein F4818DRAFT_442636 [Hypoxylon cercidicola]